MAETRGVWSLSDAWAEKTAAEWISIPNVWTEPPTVNTAYFMGGGPIPSPKSIVDKMAYSTNTTARVPSCDLGSGRNYVVGGGSKTVGYSIAGRPDYYPGSVIEKITYATDTRESVSSPAGKNRSQHGVAGNTDKLYIAAGFQGNPGATNNVVKFTFATETTSPSPNYPSSAIGISASGNQSVGYFGAGSPGNTASQVCKIDYSNDNTGLVPSSGYFTVTRKAALSASSSTGAYWAGGSPGPKSVVDKLTFATDATARIPGANMVNASKYKGGTRSSTAAYWGSETVTFDIMPFETDTCSTLPNGANLSVSREAGVGAVSSRENNNPTGLDAIRWFDSAASSPNFGYSVTGRKSSNWAPGPAMEFTYKVDYGTDTSSNSPSAGASYGLEQAFGAGNSTTGYKMGGRSNDEPADGSERGEKFVYATDTRSSAPNYGNRRYGSFMVTNGTTNLIGTAGRGQPSNNLRSNTYKMTYASESWSTVPSQNTSSTRKAGAALATSTNGYFAGGGNGQPSVYSNVDKYSFSNDTQARVPAANLTNSMDGNRGFSRGDAGYSMGGLTNGGDYISNIDKITFSTDTTAAFPSNLPDGVQSNQTMSSNSTGYAVGGQGPSPSGWDRSTVSKMSFSTGTFSASGNLPTYQHHGIGMSAGSDNLPFTVSPVATPTASTTNMGIPENGYIAGGFGNVSSISKLDMASETYTRLDTALYEAQRRLTGFGNLTQGYATGGTQPVRTTCQKFVYSTDTRTTLTSNLTSARGYIGSIGNNTAGYVGGGTPQGSQGTKLDKMPYSNETFSSLPSLPGSRYRYGSLGNQTQGYFAGGYPSQTSKVKKITYSSDSYADAPNLSYSATFQTGAGNATKGYVVSGEGAGTKVDRVTFSNDTISRVPSADLSAVRYSLEANNSPSKAYFTGGSPGVKTNTEVITFSNDTTELSTTANASTGDNQAGAFAAFGPNHCGNPGSDIQPNVI